MTDSPPFSIFNLPYSPLFSRIKIYIKLILTSMAVMFIVARVNYTYNTTIHWSKLTKRKTLTAQQLLILHRYANFDVRLSQFSFFKNALSKPYTSAKDYTLCPRIESPIAATTRLDLEKSSLVCLLPPDVIYYL